MRFVLGLFNSGLSLDIISELLTNLPKPYSYNSQQIYFDVFDSKWKYLPKEEEINEKEILVEYIKTTDDAEELRGMISTIEQRLSDLD